MPSEIHARLSASSSKRWINCQKSVVLCEKLPDEESDYATEGTIAHALAEKLLRIYQSTGSTKFKKGDICKVSQLDEATGEMKDIRTDQEMRDAIQEYVDAVSGDFEALKLKDPSARLLIEQKVNFDHWVPNGFGTSDAVIIASGVCHVFDLKYGKGVVVDGRNNSQLRLYALGAYEELNWEADITSFETHIVQPRLHWRSGESLTKEELLTWGESIKPLAKMADEGQGEFKPGDWCRSGFCPARDLCKHRAEWVLSKMLEAVRSSESDELDPNLMGAKALGEFAKSSEPFSAMASDVRNHLLTDLVNGVAHPGWKAVAGRASRDWDDPLALKKALQEAKYLVRDITEEPSLLSPSKMGKAIKKEDFKTICQPHVIVDQGKPQLAPEDDPREPYKPVSAAEDFKDLLKKEAQ